MYAGQSPRYGCRMCTELPPTPVGPASSERKEHRGHALTPWTHTNDVTEHAHCRLAAQAAEYPEGSRDSGRTEHGTEFKDVALESGEPAVPTPHPVDTEGHS